MFMLFLGLNTNALEVAKLEGLRAAAASMWMGCLLGGPRAADLEPAVWATHHEQLSGGWRSWTSVVERLVWLVAVEREVRELLEKRHLAGRLSLFRDAADEWAELEEQVGRLEAIASNFAEAKIEGHRRVRRRAPDHSERVMARADQLADDARIHAFDRLDEQPRALAILERRFKDG
jgi:biopolymer transport protein ExbB/TolQ